ncbi:L,D-transpeptidase family protein [Flavobacterium rhizosphaerae]|uniref:L,D-transpeptidase family protein n=1 Tax=Flavobacterium rhizosphaerae TaxID=3163298 RepID=A0ABW8YXA5_9FLAO
MWKYIVYTLLVLVVVLAVYYFYPSHKLAPGTVIDKLVVNKSKRVMQAYNGNTLVKTYKIALGKNPVGHKQFEGDGKTPEGTYTINERNPNSGYHKNLGISYPNAEDIAYARRLGKLPGGLIKIHGLRNGRGYIGKFHRWKNWTAGCIAVTDEEIDELYKTVIPNAVIQIEP